MKHQAQETLHKLLRKMWDEGAVPNTVTMSGPTWATIGSRALRDFLTAACLDVEIDDTVPIDVVYLR